MTEEPNIEYIINLAGEDLAFRQKFIGIVKEEFPAERRSYIENVTQNNFRAAAEDVHKLKHKINILGLVKSYDIAAKHEEELRAANTNSKDDFMAILATMKTFINTL